MLDKGLVKIIKPPKSTSKKTKTTTTAKAPTKKLKATTNPKMR
jgi:hypothetical protein